MSQTVLNFIAGAWVEGRGETVQRYNPAALDTLVSSTAWADVDQVKLAVDHVEHGYREWAAASPDTRADVLNRAATILEGRQEQLTEEIVAEEGKTRAEAGIEARRTPQNLRMYATAALTLTGTTYPTGDGSLVYTARQPVGVVAAITPWNFPLNIPSRKLGPALAAGNGVVLKPSEVTPLIGNRIVEALLEAGVPDGALAVVHGGAEVGDALTRHPAVGAVTFTGSTGVGQAIHRAVRVDVRCQLEMGGKNAVIVTEDAPLDRVLDIVLKGAFGLSGQACTGTSRLIVPRTRMAEIADALSERAAAITVGDGTGAGVGMGPLTSQAQLAKYQEYVQDAVDRGLDVRGRTEQPANGHFASPVVVADVAPDDRLAREEIFGPVLVLIGVDGVDEAIDVANATEYGLSAGIITDDIGQALAFSRRIEAGVVKVNQATSGLAMNAPFGGVKLSSTQTYKEQGGADVMNFYTVDKTVYLVP